MQPAPTIQPKRYFVTGIGTDVGKTIAAAILTEALAADYWKPVQAGSLDQTDTHTVQGLISNQKSVFHTEAYRLQLPASPHLAAEKEGIRISLDEISAPATQNHLIVEGAGGVMVPLNERELVLDLIQKLKLEVIVVSRNYLGSINHTLTTLEILKHRQIPVGGIIFNGVPTPSTQDFILQYTQVRALPSILEELVFDKATVARYAQTFKEFFTAHA
ncbi:ATP-dependent dethiobiotin synthetase BioD [Rufibacter radiotolerans]|uniref:ATP-dependent dethiobiotin synthetase BioD n=1 Tax=Rufibacter radiotolerans TaxID=1379910 RepID=A0A0H4VJ38_9BACT|nr:dethiobiotin synthase [Rufibacter radiotolerans]AKQ45830.1 ATP-dependent dethiobiotin synthetase BioD [Rufibacter radiotolerans]